MDVLLLSRFSTATARNWSRTRRKGSYRHAAAAAELAQLSQKTGGSLELLPLDVTRDESVASALGRAVAIAPLDVVINNAGISAMGLNEGFSTEQALSLFDVNVLGAQRVNRAALPGMRARGRGLLIHVSTGLSRMPMPCFGLYAASKAALEAMAESYRYELSGLGIDSLIVQPAAYPTNLGKNALSPLDQERVRAYGELANLPERMMQGLAAMFTGPNAPDPREVAETMVRLIEMPAGTRPLRTTVGGENRSLDELNALTDRLQGALLTSQGMGSMLRLRHS